MAETRKPMKKKKHRSQNRQIQPLKPEKPPPPSWVTMRGLLTCKHLQTKEDKEPVLPKEGNNSSSQGCKKRGCSGSSLCSNTRVMHRPESSSTSSSPEDSKKWVSMGCSISSNGNGSSGSSRRSIKAAAPLRESNGGVVSSTTTTSSSSSSLSSQRSSAGHGSFRGMQLRRFSGCYECRMVVDPSLLVSRDPSLRPTLCPCPDCGEVFMKSEDLELHQSVRHAVSELGPEDSSRNIVEIIFQSSWLRKQAPVCKIERILKVQNSQKTITRFEDYRESIKSKASRLVKKHPRCVADGNELLRFHCTSFVCSLGVNGSSNLCNSTTQCNVCSIIKHGFKKEAVIANGGICTTATSGRAHDKAKITVENEKRAMLVCRVIAGRVKRNQDSGAEEFDSVAGPSGIYSDLDELFVFNPKAILPCFVVIYGGF